MRSRPQPFARFVSICWPVESAPNRPDAAWLSARLDPAAWVPPQCRWWKGCSPGGPVRGTALAAGRGPGAIFADRSWWVRPGNVQDGAVLHGDPGQPCLIGP